MDRRLAAARVASILECILIEKCLPSMLIEGVVMMPRVKVYVTLKPSLLDAQGRVVQNALQSLGYHNVEQVRIGKYIEIQMEGNEANMDRQVKEMCERLLANPVIEDYRYEVEK
jgi:phosphoribosylformylglycinamidine synthase PurS subunit